MALMRTARAGDCALSRVVQPAPPPQLYRRCATSRVRVDLLSGAHGVGRGMKPNGEVSKKPRAIHGIQKVRGSNPLGSTKFLNTNLAGKLSE